jgi:hypothetical protein
MKAFAWTVAVGTLLAAAGFALVSLNRWEWNRALFFGLIVLIAEVGLATGLVLRRLARLEYTARRVDPAVTQILRENRPAMPDRFAWLRDSVTRDLNVFITFLVGGGVMISGIAWVVDRVASRSSSSPGGDERLARQLAPISYPSGGLLLDDITVLAQEVPGANDDQIRQLLRRGGR